MELTKYFSLGVATLALGGTVLAGAAKSTGEPKIPAFSVGYMDRTVSPATNFYLYANGTWVKNNPIPADKSRKSPCRCLLSISV